MPKAKTVPAGRRRRKKFLKRAKGFVGGRRKLYRTARETVQRALMFATRDRRDTKSVIRKLWITRISASAVDNGITYSTVYTSQKRNWNQYQSIYVLSYAHLDDSEFELLKEIVVGDLQDGTYAGLKLYRKKDNAGTGV